LVVRKAVRRWLLSVYDSAVLGVSVFVGILVENSMNDINTGYIPGFILIYGAGAFAAVYVASKAFKKQLPREFSRYYLKGLRGFGGVFCGSVFGSSYSFFTHLGLLWGLGTFAIALIIMMQVNLIVGRLESKLGLEKPQSN
jgi:hypothetical protein